MDAALYDKGNFEGYHYVRTLKPSLFKPNYLAILQGCEVNN